MSAIVHVPISEAKKQQWALKKLPALLYFSYALLVVLSLNNGFFWDSILQASQYGQWFYKTNFTSFFYPETIDAGYSPLFGILVAISWKIFGYNLITSHLLILPFALGVVHQVLVLSRKFLSGNTAVFAATLALADPTLLAQVTQVSPDIVLLFLYLFCLNQIIVRKRLLVALALVFLGLIHMRGTIAVACVFFTDVFVEICYSRNFIPKNWRNIILTYLPAFFIVSTWLVLHYLHAGWWAYNPDPKWSWSAGRQLVSFPEMLRNSGIIVWRVMDFGRLFIWLGLLACGLYYFRDCLKLPQKIWILLFAICIPFLFFSIISIPYSNPIGHRYYLVVYVLLAVLVCYLLAHIPNRFFRRFIYGFMLLGLLTGHFWIYPDSVAKGWDATLAHVPYFKLRHQAIAFLDAQHIPLETVGSDFPNLAPLSITDLKNDARRFKDKDLQTDAYVLYSNIFNNFSDEELAALQTNWQVVKSWKKGQVKMILYKKPEKR